MGSLVRTIEVGSQRLYQYQLDSGEHYFRSTPLAPVANEPTLATKQQPVQLVAGSNLRHYGNVPSGLVFLHDQPSALSLVTPDRQVQTYLFTSKLGEAASVPYPLIDDANASEIRSLADQIRLVATTRQLKALDDLAPVTTALYKAVTQVSTEAEAALRRCDETLLYSLSLVVSSGLPDDVARLREQVHSYERLSSTVDRILQRKAEVEEITRSLQEELSQLNVN